MNSEQYWKLYCKMVGRDPKRTVTVKAKKPGMTRRVAVVCDLHGAPYKPVVERVLGEQYDLVIPDGDLIDACAFSPFPKQPGQTIGIMEEIGNVRSFLEAVVTGGAKVIVNEGNHERRVWAAFQKHLPEEYLPLVKWDIMRILTERIPNVTVAHNAFDFTSGAGTVSKKAFNTDWLIILGDAFIGHVDIAKRENGRSADAFADYIQKWRRSMGWEEPRLVIQAHVHKANLDYAEGGHRLFVEGGVAGDPYMFQYMMDKGGGRGVPPPLGYVEFEQNKKGSKWLTDLNTVRFIMC